MSIILTGIEKRFGAFEALKGVSLEARDGEFLALLGPSGSGKTTLLRIIAGLDFPDAGTIAMGGQDVGQTATRDRHVGFVFQHYALFRHMTVFDNVAFGLRVKPRASRPAPARIEARVRELLALVQMEGLQDRYPAQLSGGQRQRVALARALAIEPRVLLLDEPFGALDAKVRKDLRRWLRRLHDEMGLTSVFVTHDQDEAMELADRVAVMNQGLIEQIGRPQDVYDRPATSFVYEFLGNVNRLPCLVAGGMIKLGSQTVGPAPAGRGDGPAILFVRPHDVALAPVAGGLPAKVGGIFAAGAQTRIDVKLPESGLALEAEVPRNGLPANLAPGAEIAIQFRGYDLFPGEGGAA